MPKAEKGTAKYLANAMKSKGLQKLKWYCQVCEKQCRDDNGFKCHQMSEGHLRQMLVVGENAGKHISDYSSNFQKEFLALLSRRWGTKRVKANTVYQEYIQDKTHLHMNATRWASLTEFIKGLGRAGIVHVDETEKGWFIAWIDSSPMTLSKQAANQLKERADLDDEQRQRKYIAEQIERAKALQEAQDAAREKEEEKSVVVDGPIQISFGVKKPSPSPEPSISASTSEPAGPVAITPAPFKLNPLKKPNPLKMNAFKGKDKEVAEPKLIEKAHSLSAVEQLMRDDLERKRRYEEGGSRSFHDAKRVKV